LLHRRIPVHLAPASMVGTPATQAERVVRDNAETPADPVQW
jgi:hypothetical protein